MKYDFVFRQLTNEDGVCLYYSLQGLIINLFTSHIGLSGPMTITEGKTHHFHQRSCHSLDLKEGEVKRKEVTHTRCLVKDLRHQAQLSDNSEGRTSNAPQVHFTLVQKTAGLFPKTPETTCFQCPL